MRQCSVTDCTNPHEARGYCQKHYTRWWNYGNVDTVKYIKIPNRQNSGAYKSYRAMISRCYTQSGKFYKYYGGRGITVHKSWLGPYGYVQFLRDMGERPEGYTLDRKNSNGNYGPKNCQWSDRQQQALNRGIQSNNTSGSKGVSLHKATGRWSAYLNRDGKKKHLGYFKTMQEAVTARIQAVLEYEQSLSK
jgi:hypothetical protein